MSKAPVYRVVFINNGKTYEIYASNVSQGALYGFVEIRGMLFDERTSLVVDPGEEKLKAEFEGVMATHVPVHAIIRIDQVEKRGVAKIGDAKGNVVTPFPLPKPDNSKS
ncbi:DUF1820 family protein [Aliikangiella maris]|uniref:DUF1820 family protein n=2 Tax=Aliikangiella maris TaxID=3162458 RepID=A0ABV3MKY2_9GAMM